MKWQEIKEAAGVGRITKQNQTVDVGPDEVRKQAAKFGNTVDKDGKPPTLSKKVKGSKTNVLFNLGLAEGYKLQLERDKELLVLHIKDTATGKRTEVRGKLGYETNYDPNDSLHKLLDKVGKSANISELMNGEVVTINPKHPDADRAKAATDKAYSETYTRDQLPQIKNSQLKNIKHTVETVDIDTIIPVQQERIIENFKRQVDNIVAGNYKPIIVDNKNRIVNGHHRYTALQMLEYTNIQVAKLPWTLEQILENFADDRVKYAEPQFDVEWEEAERYPEFRKIGKEAWIELAKKGKAVTIKSAKGINNTDAADPDSFKSLDAVKQGRALDQLKSGTVEMPIVAVYSDGWKELIGGNTRLTAMLAQNGRANVWAFKVPDEVAALAENFADGKNQIKEALDNPYPVRWSMKDDDEWEGKAKTEAGDSIQIMITQGHNNHKWEIDFYVGGSMQVTGKGDQFRVFATVVSAVKKWWSWLSKSKQPVEAIIFSAFKGNKSTKGSAGRSNLYNRFATQFARSIGFTVSTVDGSDNIKFMLTNPNYKDQQAENFADGKKKGKSRPGRVKRAGASCNGSVTDLRKRAKNASGEKAKMYHWCANMKSGKKK